MLSIFVFSSSFEVAPPAKPGSMSAAPLPICLSRREVTSANGRVVLKVTICRVCEVTVFGMVISGGGQFNFAFMYVRAFWIMYVEGHQTSISNPCPTPSLRYKRGKEKNQGSR